MNGQADRPDEEIEEQIEEQPAAEDVVEVDSEQVEEAQESLTDLEQAQAKAAENWDRYLRCAAELENVRKRSARDVENAHRFALERFSREMLAVKASLDLGMAAAETASIESLLQGSDDVRRHPDLISRSPPLNLQTSTCLPKR